MAAAEVTYADVKLPKSKAKADNRLSSEVTYSEVRRLRKLSEDSQPFDSSEMRNPQPRRQTKRRPIAERAALLVLSFLLAAAIIALSVTQINCRNTHSELEMCKASPPPSCPPHPAVEDLRCLKCEEGWEPHRGNCYYFNTNKSSWNDSRRSCADLGSDLVKINSREEQTVLGKKLRRFMNQMKMNETETFWIGLTDSKEEGKWFWVDGSPLNESLSFWSEDQPGNKHGGNKIVEDQIVEDQIVEDQIVEDQIVEDQIVEDQCSVRMGRKTKEEEMMNWFNTSCVDPHRGICEKAANVS